MRALLGIVDERSKMKKVYVAMCAAGFAILAACSAESPSSEVVTSGPGELRPADCPGIACGPHPVGSDCAAYDPGNGCPLLSCPCNTGLVCDATAQVCCQPSTALCNGAICGAVVQDGCGNLITCTQGATNCQCDTCAGKQCGSLADGCGNVLNCGSCLGATHCGGGHKCYKNCAAGYTDCNNDGHCVKISSCM